MHEKLPSLQEMEAAGFTPEDYEGDPVDVWPENHRAYILFEEFQSQWLVGGLGNRIALNYGPLFMRMERMRLSDEEWELLFRDIRVMEDAALAEMNKKV